MTTFWAEITEFWDDGCCPWERASAVCWFVSPGRSGVGSCSKGCELHGCAGAQLPQPAGDRGCVSRSAACPGETPGTGHGATVSHSWGTILQCHFFPIKHYWFLLCVFWDFCCRSLSPSPLYSVVFLYEWQMKAVLVLTQMMQTHSRALCPAFLVIQCLSIGV